jgi:hypothetical protein
MSRVENQYCRVYGVSAALQTRSLLSLQVVVAHHDHCYHVQARAGAEEGEGDARLCSRLVLSRSSSHLTSVTNWASPCSKRRNAVGGTRHLALAAARLLPRLV